MSPALALDGTHKLALRGYQEETLDKTFAALNRGVRRQMWVLATGLGKTVALVSLAERLGMRTLIIAHRDELIQQAVAKVRQWWPDADVGVVKAERNDFGAQDVIVASVQSLTPGRLARMGRFGLVIIDECHRAGGATYSRVVETLRCGQPDGPILLGVTATPSRSDGKGLSVHFDEITATYDTLFGIRNGYLVDIKCKEVKLTNLRLEDVNVSRGDYADGALSAAMAEAQAPWHIVKAWKELASDRLTASFHPTIEAAKAQAAEFMAQGVPAACISGVDVDERRRILQNLAAGRIKVVSNALLLVEGWDFPPLSCIIQGRPTKHQGIYQQIVGRALRPYPGKDNALILDVTGSSERMDLCSVPSLFGVEKKAMRKGATVTEAVEAKAAAEAKPKPKPGPRLTGDVVTRDVDLFKQHGVKPGKVAWAKTRSGAFATSAGKMSVVMEPTGLDSWTVATIDQSGHREELMTGVPLSLAQGIADDHVRRNAPASLTDRMAPWRKKPPSEKSLVFAQRLGIGVPEGWSADDVSRAIDARLAEIRAGKARRATGAGR